MSERNILNELNELADSKVAFSDLLIQLDKPIMMRTPAGWKINGHLEIPSYDDIKGLCSKLDVNWEEKIGRGAISRAFNIGNWRFRACAFLADAGTTQKVCIRKLPSAPPTFRDTGLPDQVRLMLESRHGLVLVSGGTGNGKSTTMASILSEFNATRKDHVVTIEDPIEYVFTSNQCVFTQREVGVDAPSFSEGVTEAMRQSPNVVMIGEIRDKETAAAALLIAESGHFVIGSVHANSAPGTIQKMLSFFPDHERNSRLMSLQNTLIGVVNQVLLPHQEKEAYVLAAEVLCNHKGQFSSKLGDSAALRMEMENDKASCITMVQSLAAMVNSKIISKREAAIAAGPDLIKLSNLVN